MASPNTGGYDHEFLDPPAKLKEFECPLCLLVTREPNLTSCCGQHFCQSCINRIITDRKPCPLCKVLRFRVLLDKKQRRNVLALDVRCPMSVHGCRWTGQLASFQSHADRRSGDCGFVDVSCPNNCGESIQRRLLDSHLSEACPKRLFVCKYCELASEDTFEEICHAHYSECSRFPICCPNNCDTGLVERGKLRDHLSECLFQLVDCEFAHVGCCEKLQRKDLTKHMEQNMQKHIVLAVAKNNRELQAQMESRMKRLIEAKDRQILDLKRELNEIRTEKDKQLKKKIDFLENRISTLERLAGLPQVLTVAEYSKIVGTKGTVESPVMTCMAAKVYFRMKFHIKMLHVDLFQDKVTPDDDVTWPVNCEATVELLNQMHDHSHIVGRQNYSLEKPKFGRQEVFPSGVLTVRYTTIEYATYGAQYVVDDCLKIRVSIK